MLREGHALIVVDVRDDFLPGGSLGVPMGDAVIEPLNRCIEACQRQGLPVFATRDWHPPDHGSYQPQGASGPPHCVAGTPGAEFPARLSLPPDVRVVSKATTAQADAYSAFEGTDLAALLLDTGSIGVLIGGLATQRVSAERVYRL